MEKNSDEIVCQHFIVQQQKMCQFIAQKGNDYCQYHKLDGDRIPCPLDNNHYIDKKQLEHHLKVCTKTRDQQKIQQSEWYKQKINLKVTQEVPEIINQGQSEQKTVKLLQKLFNAKDAQLFSLIDSIPQIFQQSIELYYNQLQQLKIPEVFDQEQLYKYIFDDQSISTPLQNVLNKDDDEQINKEEQKIEVISQQIKPNQEDIDMAQSNVSFETISDTEKDKQQLVLITNLMKNQELINEKFCYVEYGAGKGQLSHQIASCFPTGTKSFHILLEREARRNQFDKHHRENPFFMRFRTDICDFNMNSIPQIMSDQDFPFQDVPSVVGVAKHMCGFASDLSINSLLMYDRDQLELRGMCIATCCHHRCNEKQYSNLEFLNQSLGIQSEFLQLLFAISSWYVSGSIIKQNNVPEPDLTNIKDDITSQRKTELGKMVKRVIDIGRVMLMLEKNYRCQLIQYCDAGFSPENFCIVLY